MGMKGYPQYLPVVMKLMNNYISSIVNNRNFRKISVKEHTGFAFTQTQDNYAKYKENISIKVESHFLHCGNKYHWSEESPNLEE